MRECDPRTNDLPFIELLNFCTISTCFVCLMKKDFFTISNAVKNLINPTKLKNYK